MLEYKIGLAVVLRFICSAHCGSAIYLFARLAVVLRYIYLIGDIYLTCAWRPRGTWESLVCAHASMSECLLPAQ